MNLTDLLASSVVKLCKVYQAVQSTTTHYPRHNLSLHAQYKGQVEPINIRKINMRGPHTQILRRICTCQIMLKIFRNILNTLRAVSFNTDLPKNFFYCNCKCNSLSLREYNWWTTDLSECKLLTHVISTFWRWSLRGEICKAFCLIKPNWPHSRAMMFTKCHAVQRTRMPSVKKWS
jgi:hypothetical protein